MFGREGAVLGNCACAGGRMWPPFRDNNVISSFSASISWACKCTSCMRRWRSCRSDFLSPLYSPPCKKNRKYFQLKSFVHGEQLVSKSAPWTPSSNRSLHPRKRHRMEQYSQGFSVAHQAVLGMIAFQRRACWADPAGSCSLVSTLWFGPLLQLLSPAKQNCVSGQTLSARQDNRKTKHCLFSSSAGIHAKLTYSPRLKLLGILRLIVSQLFFEFFNISVHSDSFKLFQVDNSTELVRHHCVAWTLHLRNARRKNSSIFDELNVFSLCISATNRVTNVIFPFHQLTKCKQRDQTYLCCFFCELFSSSSSCIRCCKLTRPWDSKIKHSDRSAGSKLFTVCCIWWSFKVTTTSNSFNFCCFSSWNCKKRQLRTQVFLCSRQGVLRTLKLKRTWNASSSVSALFTPASITFAFLCSASKSLLSESLPFFSSARPSSISNLQQDQIT